MGKNTQESCGCIVNEEGKRITPCAEHGAIIIVAEAQHKQIFGDSNNEED